jgi:hypothetical protein
MKQEKTLKRGTKNFMITRKTIWNEVIDHWTEICCTLAINLGKNLSDLNLRIDSCACAFCRAFKNCSGCPIRNHTGYCACLGTPYIKVSYLWRYEKATKELIDAAQEELNFLLDLRKQE